MTTTKLKSDLFRFIEEINDKNILTALRSLLISKSPKPKKDFWDDLTEKEKKEILQAIEELDNRQSHSFSEVLARHRKK
jgi:TRAP-type C4-dicarboxylate transport system substrate-binding protein